MTSESVRKSNHNRLIALLNQAKAHPAPMSLTDAETYLQNCESLMKKAEAAHEELVRLCHDDAAIQVQDSAQAPVDATYLELKRFLANVIRGHASTATTSGNQGNKLHVKLPQMDLAKFDGKYANWMSFRDLFTAQIDSNQQLQPSQKLQYLRGVLLEEPLSIIRSLPITDLNYKEAWRLLEARYDNRKEIITSWNSKLLFCKAVTKEDPTLLQQLLDNANECIRALTTLGEPTDKLDSMLVTLLSSKVDPATRREWAIKSAGTAMPSYKDFTTFLTNHIRGLQASGVPSSGPQPRAHQGQRPTVKVHHTSTYKCLICNGSHPHYQCQAFQAMTPKERNAAAAKHNMCFNCLRDSHSMKNCPSKSTCRKCNRKHHTMLHDPDQHKVSAHLAEESASTSATTELEATHVSTTQHVLLQTAMVMIPDATGTLQPCRALLDNGSQGSFLTEECAARLNLPRRASSIRISGIGANQGGSTSGLVTATLHSTSKPRRSIEMELNVLPRLTRQLPSVACSTARWEHTAGLTLADPAYHTPQKIDLLIGSDYSNEVVLDGRKTGPPGAPVAQQTIFGWVLSGPTPVLNVHTIQICHSTNELEMLRRFWEVEEPPQANLMTKQERQCEDHFSATYKRDASGRFTVTIPFTSRLQELGQSRVSAERRLISVERRLARNPQYLKPYHDFMEEYLRLGHMERVPPAELLQSTGPTYYIPHHYVTNEDSSTTKVRVVFDASAKTSTGVSLNDCILVGPTVQPDLYTHLLRFRLPAVAIKADIEKMFRMFQLDRSQVDTHRILWRSSPSEPISEYRLLTVTYGTAYATYLATRCLKQLALENEILHPIAAKALGDHTYVDDLLSGASSVTAASEAFSELTTVTRSAHLNLRKWSSNSKEFLQPIPEELRETDPYNFSSGETTKALGVMWYPAKDEFFFRHIQFDQPGRLTKRKLLSNIAKVFDPLGLISPVTLQGKLMLQELWKDPHGWDEMVPAHISELYAEYQSGFTSAPDLKFPRRLTADNATRYEMHGFCDASEKAYGAAVYIRMITPGGVQVALASSKTRVAPLRQVSLPRLELMAAFLLAELISEVTRILNLDHELFLWSDSTIALAWIYGEPRRWNTFVANRVARIQELTPTKSWRHVPGYQNPADLCSRGCSVQELVLSSLWFQGPDWLISDSPTDEELNSFTPPETEEEARRVPVAVHVATEALELMSRFSTLHKTTRVLAFVLRWPNNFLNRSLQQLGPLTCDELRNSLHRLVKLAQVEAYPEELAALQQGQQVPSRSKLKTLFPYLDQQGALRVSSRLQHANIAGDRKNLLILPSKSHLTSLVIEEAHRRTLHGGLLITWATIQQRFWIPSGRSRARHYIRSCVICRRHRAEAAQQLMGSLPEPRVTVSRPFAHAGVDYAGPFTLKNPVGRAPKTYKGYFCVFVCLATRAVHLEAVSSLTTEAFLDTLHRFTSRRGISSRLYSDHGTNFVGAERELGDLLKQWKERKDVPDHLSKIGIEWEWAPPSAPHHNGMAEAGVKSAKHHLRRIMGTVPQTYEAFSTLLCQIEAILNSRPIHPLSSDPDDLQALTPGHFLIGEPLLQLPSPDLLDIPTNRLTLYQRQQQRVQQFWQRWSRDVLNTLHQRTKWYSEKENLAVGDLVLIIEDTAPGTWKMARVLETHLGADNRCRVVTLKTATTTLKRPIVKLVPLLNAA